MLPRKHSDGIRVAFDDHRLVANTGLLLPVSLVQRLGLGELADQHVDPGYAPGRANAGDKLLTLVASALAGGDCIDAADALSSGSTGWVLGCVVKAPSTLGTGWRRLHRRRRRAEFRQHRAGVGQRGQGALHPGHHPGQLPVGPCPAVGPGEPGTAGPGLGRMRYAAARGQLTLRAPGNALPALSALANRPYSPVPSPVIALPPLLPPL